MLNSIIEFKSSCTVLWLNDIQGLTSSKIQREGRTWGDNHTPGWVVIMNDERIPFTLCIMYKKMKKNILNC